MSVRDLFAAPARLGAGDPLAKIEQRLFATVAPPSSDLRARILAGARQKSEVPRSERPSTPGPIASGLAQPALALVLAITTPSVSPRTQKNSLRARSGELPRTPSAARAQHRLATAASIAAAALLLLNFARSVSFRDPGSGRTVNPLFCARLAEQPSPLLAELNPSLQRACDGPER